MISKIFLSFALLSALSIVQSCNPGQEYFPPNGAKAIAVLKGSLAGSPVAGTVQFQQKTINDVVIVSVNVTGLIKGKSLKHGLHVHMAGISSTSDNVTEICGSSGAHFNPTNQTHGDILAKVRHVGDYGNVVSDVDGTIVAAFKDNVSTLYGPFGVIGRTIVLHQDEDDLGLGNATDSKTTGHAGNRIACGVIGISV